MSILNRTHVKTDEEIVSEYWARDQQAIEDTSARFGETVYRVCRRILRDPQTAKECVNDVYLKAWSSIPPNRPNDLAAYLSVIARSTAVDRLRLETRGKRVKDGLSASLDDFQDLLSSDDDVADELEAKELSHALERFLRGVSRRERTVFIKRFYFACTVSEIVSETGIPRSVVYKTLKRLKQELKTFLEQEGYRV